MTIEGYMGTVLANLRNKSKLVELRYNENDKDCGYRSALRYLGIAQTAETDAIANRVIYRESKPEVKQSNTPSPMQLGFSW